MNSNALGFLCRRQLIVGLGVLICGVFLSGGPLLRSHIADANTVEYSAIPDSNAESPTNQSIRFQRPDISGGAPEGLLPPAERAALETAALPRPNSVVAPLNADTNPAVALGEWRVYSTTNSFWIGSDYISAIAFDSAGRPWAGTGFGLSRFDGGVSWTTYNSPTLASDLVSAVAVDGRDQVWAGSPDHGVSVRLASHAWAYYLGSYNVTSIAAVGTDVWVGSKPRWNGSAWVGGGIARFDASTDPPTLAATYTVSNTGGGLASNTINTIVVGYHEDEFCFRSPEFWIGHDKGVSVSFKVLSIPSGCDWGWRTYSRSTGDPLPDVDISAIAVDTHNRVWFGGHCFPHGLAVLEGSTWITYTTANSGLTYDGIQALGADPQGRIWIAQTEVNCLKMSRAGPGAESALAPSTFPNKVTLNVFDEGTWCYYEVGGGTCQNPSPPAGLPSTHVRAIAAGQERVWFGTAGAGVATVTLNWKHFSTLNSQMLSYPVYSVWLDSGPGLAWLGEYWGVDRFDGGNWHHYVLSSSLTSEGILALHRDDAGRLWAGEGWYDSNPTRHSSAWLYQPGSDSWRRYQVPGTGGVTSLSSDLSANKRLWVATAGGGVQVFNVNSSSWVSLTTATTPIASDVVNAVVRDNAGRMWMGTDRGLSVYTGTGWMTYTVASTSGGLMSNVVYALAADRLGRMWVGTYAGVSVLSGTIWTTYTMASTGGGLGDDRIIALAVDPANRVWAGTSYNGIGLFDGSHWTSLNSFNSGLLSNWMDDRAIATDNSGGVWLGFSTGLNVRGILAGPIGLPTPTITNFTPGSGPVNTFVTISGANFYFGSLDTNKVYFAGPGGTWVEANVVSRSGNASAGTLTVLVPFNAVKGPIMVAHSGGVAVSSGSFSPIPTVQSYAPTSAGPGLELVVWGANLGGTNSRIRFSNGVEVHNEEPLVGNQLKIAIPFSAASGPLMLLTDGGSVTLSPPFTFASLCPLRSDNTCAPSGDGSAIEINQGLPDDMYPLVTGKPTLVRVYVGSSSDANVMVDFGMLTISGPGGASVRIATIPQTVFNNQVRDFSERRNVNFYLNGSEIPTSGDYTFDVTLRARGSTVYNASISRSIQSTKDISFMVTIWGDNATVGELNALQKAMATIERTYPVRRGGVGFALLSGFMAIPPQYFIGTPGRPEIIRDTVGGFGYATGQMEFLRANNEWRPLYMQSLHFDDAVGFVPLHLNPVSLWGGAWWKYPVFGLSTTNMNALTTTQSGLVVSQEVAHNLGLVYGGPTDNGHLHSKNEFILSPGGSDREPRAFNVVSRVAIAEPYTVMWPACCSATKSNDTVFFEPADFAPLINAIRSLPGTATNIVSGQAIGQATHNVFTIFGTISVTGTVNRAGSFVVPAGAPVTPLSPGPYYLVFLDTNNRILASDGFSVSFVATHDGPSDTGSFSVARPMPDGTVQVQIRRDSTILATYHISPNPPTVSITSPMGGSFGAAQNVTVAWTASDPDSDPLTFSAFYSRDDGATWLALKAGMTDNSFVWNTGLAGGAAPGSFSRLKIIASDGFNTAEVVSNRFTVTGKPPIVSIIAPTAATRHVEGQPIYFEGLGTDLEDGLLPPSSLHWSSDRDGILGGGATLSATLTVGTHLITLNGFDSNGNSAHDQVVVIVLSDFDGDGIPDADEPDNFWNPNDASMVISGVTKLDYSLGITSPPAGTPGLAVNPSGLAMVAERGGGSAHGAITIQSTDLKPLSWTATKTRPWLDLSATSGSTLATLDVTADPSGLGDGTYLDTIHIQAGTFAQTVTVTLAVTSRAGPPRKVYLPIIMR